MANQTDAKLNPSKASGKSPSRFWHHTPDLPINTSPYFIAPHELTSHLKWLYRSWLPLTERLIFLCLAFFVLALLHPASGSRARLCLGMDITGLAEKYHLNDHTCRGAASVSVSLGTTGRQG